MSRDARLRMTGHAARGLIAAAVAMGLAFGGIAAAVDRADLEGTQITGSRELPKVLYIVPWKPPRPTDLVGRPAQSLLDEALAPLDREVFRREIQYHSLLESAGNPPHRGEIQ